MEHNIDSAIESIDNLHISKNNKGIGAGGKNTNLKGKNFEEITNAENILKDYEKCIINNSKYGYFLHKKVIKETDNEIFCAFLLQNGFKTYFKKHYNLDFFRCPDECFIIQDKTCMNIYIIEKKEQCVDGSVETKLWSCPSLKREYEIVLEDNFKKLELEHNVKIHYILCVSKFLQGKFETNYKYKILERILKENDVNILYGESNDYFKNLKEIINF